MNRDLTTPDGLKLHLRHWPRAGARGTVLVVHGLGEHTGRYEHVAARLNDGGWNVVAHDQRGHGRSDGARGTLAAADSLLADLAAVIDTLRADRAGPLLLLGHSMGGLVAARFCAEGLVAAAGAAGATGASGGAILEAGAMSETGVTHGADATGAGGSAASTLAAAPAPWYRPVDALVLSSPALDAGLNAGQRLLLSVLAPLAPNLRVNNGLKPAWISRDPAVVKAYVDDPLVHDRVTPRLVRFIVEGGRQVRGCASRWRVPTLLMAAGSDRCVSPAGSAAFAQAAPAGRVRTRVFAPLFHEIFNEPEQDEVFDELGRWLAAFSARP